MNVSELRIREKAECIVRSCLFLYPPLRRFSPEEISPKDRPVGKTLKVRHAASETAEWYAIRGDFMRARLWNGLDADAYVVIKKEQMGIARVTTIQPYRIG
jgi:predicted phosphatase